MKQETKKETKKQQKKQRNKKSKSKKMLGIEWKIKKADKQERKKE